MEQRFAVRRSTLLGLTLLIAAPLAGCLDTPSAFDIKDEIERELPGARFVQTEHVHLGRFTMALIHGLAGLVGMPGKDDDSDHGLEMARAIHGIDVTTYKVESLPPLDGVALPARFADQLAHHGWSVVVRTSEAAERTWVLSHQEANDSLTGLCVVSLEPGELTIVRIDGRLDRVMALALADHPKRLAAAGKETS